MPRGGLFQLTCKLEKRRFVPVTTSELNANRQAPVGPMQRHRHGRLPGHVVGPTERRVIGDGLEEASRIRIALVVLAQEPSWPGENRRQHRVISIEKRRQFAPEAVNPIECIDIVLSSDLGTLVSQCSTDPLEFERLRFATQRLTGAGDRLGGADLPKNRADLNTLPAVDWGTR